MNLAQRPLKKKFARFVIPSVAAQWVFALYTMVDGMFVARGVGETALAAVNLSLPFVNFIFALSLILAVGSSTIISVCFGKNDRDGANRAYSQNLLTAGIVSLVLAAAALFNLDAIARFLGAQGDTLDYVKTYVGTIAAFSPCFMLSYYFEILIKADGRPKLATIMVATGTVLNCILDYVLVFIVPWGIFGAAFATGLSQLVVMLGFVVYFFLTKKSTLRPARFRFSPGLAWRTFRLGLPGGITDFSAGLMIFFFNHAILTYLGEQAIVSYTIVAYVNTIVVMSLTGIAQGMQPLVSYSHGRGDTATCNRLLRYGMLTAAGLSFAILVPTWLGARGIVGIFISPELTALRQYSVEVFRIFSLSFIPVGFNVIASSWLTAVERDLPAMLISLGRGFVLLLGTLWLLTTLFGGAGIWWTPTVTELLCALLSGTLLTLALRKRRQADTLRAPPKKSA